MKNRNKNPIAEKAVQELEFELRRVKSNGGHILQSELAIATSILNGRVRNRGLSAKEIVYQRDNVTGEQLNFSDAHMSETQRTKRVANHVPSARSQARTDKQPLQVQISVGDLIYVKSDGDKHTARDKYSIVTALDDKFIIANKFTGFQFRNNSYQLKYSEVFKVPTCLPPARQIQPSSGHCRKRRK